MKKTLFGCLISAMLLLSGCGAESTQQAVTTTQAIPEAKICVTLGDSISAGFGLDNSQEERYSTLLTAMLGEVYRQMLREELQKLQLLMYSFS